MAPNPIVNLIVQGARARGLDPAAVLAVASQEGLSGRIGDGGHAYGAFQLNNAGGVITGTHPGVNDPATQAWANSPQGINFALDRIAGVAKGLKGQQAVSAIVSRFERPRDPGKEIAGANAAYGNYGTVPQAPAALAPILPPGGGTPPAPRGLSAGLLQAVNTGNEMFGLAPLPAALTAAPVAAPTLTAPPLKPLTQPVIPGAPVAPTTLKGLTMVSPKIATRGGIQIDKALLPTVSQIVRQFGVKVNSGYRSPAHNAQVGGAPSSDHLAGNAVDFTGSQENMRRLYAWAQTQPFKYLEPWDKAATGGVHVHISF